MVNNLPLISVVVLNFNGTRYLQKTLPRLLNFNYPNYEIFLVDNKSTDGSLDFIQEVQKSSTIELTLIKNRSNYGYSKGKNVGVKKARGEYILLLDEDILIKDTKLLHKLFDYYLSETKIAFLGLALVDKDETSTKKYGCYMDVYGTKELTRVSIDEIKGYTGSFEVVSPNGGAIFFSKRIWQEVGGYDESHPFNLDDFDIGIRSYLLGYTNYLFTNSIQEHLGVEQQDRTGYWSWKYKYYFSGRARMMAKNYQTKTFLLSFPLFCIFSFLKTMKQSYERRDLRIIKNYVYSIASFLIQSRKILKERKKVQSTRRIKSDSFFSVHPPI